MKSDKLEYKVSSFHPISKRFEEIGNIESLQGGKVLKIQIWSVPVDWDGSIYLVPKKQSKEP